MKENLIKIYNEMVSRGYKTASLTINYNNLVRSFRNPNNYEEVLKSIENIDYDIENYNLSFDVEVGIHRSKFYYDKNWKEYMFIFYSEGFTLYYTSDYTLTPIPEPIQIENLNYMNNLSELVDDVEGYIKMMERITNDHIVYEEKMEKWN